MNIIYIAYSCAPYRGSEEKIGWSIPLESSKKHNVFVFTKAEHKTVIDNYLQSNPIEGLSFYYVDIPDVWKKIFKGPFYSGRLNCWHKQAYKLVEKVCEEYAIDVIHQINPVEFRSVGGYGKIKNTPFICGPLGGGEYIPRGLYPYIEKNWYIEFVRGLANFYYKLRYKINRRLNRCSKILAANGETQKYLSDIMGDAKECGILTEVGIDNEILSRHMRHNSKCVFLVAGRLVYRKGHALLLDALSRLPKELDYECRIIGDGPEKNRLKKQCEEKEISERVVFMGEVPFTEMKNEYNNADVFIMPSLRETTGSVLLEAMSFGLPVVTINRYGGAKLVNENIGWLYDGETTENFVENIKKILLQCIENPEQVEQKGKNAWEYVKNFTWEEKCKTYNEMYQNIKNKGAVAK